VRAQEAPQGEEAAGWGKWMGKRADGRDPPLQLALTHPQAGEDSALGEGPSSPPPHHPSTQLAGWLVPTYPQAGEDGRLVLQLPHNRLRQLQALQGLDPVCRQAGHGEGMGRAWVPIPSAACN